MKNVNKPNDFLGHYVLKLTLILNARLNPEAKKPPNGPIIELNKLKDIECKTKG